MHILFILIFLLSGIASAEVFKSTSPDGIVEFSDVPSKQKQEPVKLSPMSTFKAPPRSESQASKPTEKTGEYTYTNLSISSPANEATIRDNAGTLPVSVAVTPALHRNHKFILLMDGIQVGESGSGNFTVNNVDRGSHSLSAQVVDKEGKTLISASPVTVFLHRQAVSKPRRFK